MALGTGPIKFTLHMEIKTSKDANDILMELDSKVRDLIETKVRALPNQEWAGELELKSENTITRVGVAPAPYNHIEISLTNHYGDACCDLSSSRFYSDDLVQILEVLN